MYVILGPLFWCGATKAADTDSNWWFHAENSKHGLSCRAAFDLVAIKALALQFLIVGVLYPSVAGLDSSRQTLYLNVCAVGFLVFTAWLLATRQRNRPTEQTGAAAAMPSV